MSSAVIRCTALAALACVAVGCSSAADPGARSLPSRPGAAFAPVSAPASLPSIRLGGADCVSLRRAAAALGLRVTEREHGRSISMSGPGTRADLEADTRDITVNGLRVFLGHPVTAAHGELYVSRIDLERCLEPLLRPGVGITPLAPPKVIAIDAGHGGRDFGKINEQLKINEKTSTLDTARRLKKLLEADGYRVVLTRDDDRYVDLAERSAIANRAGADLFISIHFNALATDRRTSGIELYTFAPQYQRSTESWMPGKKDDAQPTPEPANEFDYWNALLAQSLHRATLTDLHASDRGKKLMHLGVLRSLRCPGTLVECGFLSSDIEARKIATPAYRQQIAEALRNGVRDYTELIVTLRQKSRASATTTRDRASRPS